MGSNMAEAHPVGFQWVMEAKARGTQVVHIDPRFTRTSAVADRHVPLRAGTDIAFLGGVINYILSNELDFREYVTAYTNASFLVDERYQDTEDLDGLFSGYDHDTASYDQDTWHYESTDPGGRSGAGAKERAAPDQHGSGGPPIEGGAGDIPADPTLQHPRCVYQILKRHYARYTPEMVERVCGVPAEQFLQVARAWTENSGRERTAALVYSTGWTQHSVGAQYIRAGSIIQLLLGNIGRPGGGVFALRGHASIQGSTDVSTLFDLLPGYLAMPQAGQATLSDYLDNIKSQNQKGFWYNADAYMVSLLKEYWGEQRHRRQRLLLRLSAADQRRPRHVPHGRWTWSTARCSATSCWARTRPSVPRTGGCSGWAWPTSIGWWCGSSSMIESATFWKDGPEVETGEITPETCRTEVFVFPAASHVEKAGTFTQTQRMLQWREKAVEPPGDARSELWFFYHLGRILREKLAGSTDERDRPLLDLAWDYAMERRRAVGRGRAAAHQRCRPDDGPGGQQLPRPQGRRQHRVRVLDLQRRLRRRGQPGGAAQTARRAGALRVRVGLDVADEPPGALQPRVGRPAGPAVE